MHISLLISTILGAGACAFPQHKHADLHEKRGVSFYSQWLEGSHTLVREFVDETTVVVSAPLPSPTHVAVGAKADYENPYGGTHPWKDEEARKQYESPAALVTTVTAAPETRSPVITSMAVSSAPPATSILQATLVEATPASSSSAPESSSSDTTISNTFSEATKNDATSGACNPTGGAAWYSPPCTGSSGASVIDKLNSMRTTWNSSLSNYNWSSSLAQNSYDTAWLETTWTLNSNGNYTPTGEGGGWVMGHKLFNGSLGQCIASGDNTKSKGDITPIETMFLEWFCEVPTPGIQDLCTATGNTKGDPNCYCANIEDGCNCGHAMILQDQDFGHVGCYYMDKSEPKRDDAVNEELDQEIQAAGMLTCDFGP